MGLLRRLSKTVRKDEGASSDTGPDWELKAEAVRIFEKASRHPNQMRKFTACAAELSCAHDRRTSTVTDI